MTIVGKNMFSGLVTERVAVFDRSVEDVNVEVIETNLMWFNKEERVNGRRRVVSGPFFIEIQDGDYSAPFTKVGENPAHPCHGTYYSSRKEALAELRIECDRIFARREEAKKVA